jgi:hypothetical protein
MVTENDVFAGLYNDDDNYTGQFKFELYVKDIFDKGAPFPFIRNWKSPENNNRSFYFNGQGYTPARKYFDSTALITTDRPYASVLNYGFQRTAWWNSIGTGSFGKRLKFRMTTDLSIGQMGSKVPGKVQNFIHEYITVKSKPVRGWDNQIGAPGRFVLTYRGYGTLFYQLSEIKKDPKDEFFNSTFNSGVTYDLTTGLFMNYFNLGLTFNTLDINVMNGSNIPSLHNYDAKGFVSSRDVYQNTSFRERNQMFFELNPSLKFVGHNSTLVGHPIEDKSAYTIDPKNVKKVVPEMSFRIIHQRINFTDHRIFQFTYGFNMRGREFVGGVPFHVYATIGLQTFKVPRL